MPVLHPKPLVEFDPSNEEHLVALGRIVLKTEQHPDLRFKLEDPSSNVPAELVKKYLRSSLPPSVLQRL